MIKYDLVIPAAPKDFNKTEFCIKSAIKYLQPQPEKFFIIAPIESHIEYIENNIITVYDEQEVLKLDPKACKNFHRPEWIYAQFIKMFQNITPEEDYLVVDADLIFNRTFNVFSENNKRQLFLGVDQYHKPYFNFMEKYLNLSREYNHSFICEIMLFNKYISKNISNVLGGVEEFYNMCANIMCEDCLTADYEIYGNYVYKYYKDMYELKKIKTNLTGKYDEWLNTEICDLQNNMLTKDYDIFTYHTWI